jgi:hypothetical protein
MLFKKKANVKTFDNKPSMPHKNVLEEKFFQNVITDAILLQF